MVETLGGIIQLEKEFKFLRARSPIASQVKFQYPEFMTDRFMCGDGFTFGWEEGKRH